MMWSRLMVRIASDDSSIIVASGRLLIVGAPRERVSDRAREPARSDVVAAANQAVLGAMSECLGRDGFVSARSDGDQRGVDGGRGDESELVQTAVTAAADVNERDFRRQSMERDDRVTRRIAYLDGERTGRVRRQRIPQLSDHCWCRAHD